MKAFIVIGVILTAVGVGVAVAVSRRKKETESGLTFEMAPAYLTGQTTGHARVHPVGSAIDKLLRPENEADNYYAKLIMLELMFERTGVESTEHAKKSFKLFGFWNSVDDRPYFPVDDFETGWSVGLWKYNIDTLENWVVNGSASEKEKWNFHNAGGMSLNVYAGYDRTWREIISFFFGLAAVIVKLVIAVFKWDLEIAISAFVDFVKVYQELLGGAGLAGAIESFSDKYLTVTEQAEETFGQLSTPAAQGYVQGEMAAFVKSEYGFDMEF